MRWKTLVTTTVATAIATFAVATPNVTPADATTQLSQAKAEAAQLTAQISKLDQQAQAAMNTYDQLQLKLATTKSQIATLQGQIVRREADVARLKAKVASEAVNIFTQAGASSSVISIAKGTPNDAAIIQTDVTAATANQEAAVAAYVTAKQALELQQASLRSAMSDLATQSAQAQSAAQAAQNAQAQAQAQLASVNSQIQQLVAQQLAAEQAAQAQAAAAAAQREAAALAAAQAQQARAAQDSAPTPAVVVSPSGGSAPAPTPTSPSGYVNPLADTQILQVERIDQGVDYLCNGPITALGAGRIVSTYEGGWPNGVFLDYQLTSGPAAGDYVYVAEDVVPTVAVGQAVSAGQQIATCFPGSDGIETGWAAPGGIGEAYAGYAGQWNNSNSTAFGLNFSQLLSALGAPGGIVYGPVVGSLPAGWPGW
ncbi:conserved hypothetical protein [Acidimicrobium ferrooxidans DSM 10331]|uniref:Peptidase M23 n=1 Tax=Acidimicrobium ferrooxidans (strain DSM 10331 / JCM 15462 / NBRC 103882 / ICP) TaxID=525909 RepID=C7M2H0_ACIFD|nr:hypothetical protein [Acidimicrobium ferrooxidans]ACU53214.1 conserved hypothetical protein [Acidimicrobium ferrooxidans DSM 10331]